ncbi:MAG: DUF3747 domain-containing protein [Cyanobacteriota bacterium]|nr:DUF3747 domain-containing protein [Cyanobacteriota bacterium]
MKRPYLAVATLALVATLAPVTGALPPLWARGLFSSAAVEPNRFAVLARPVGVDDWTLVVLEQLRARPFCWTPRPDGLVDPTLNRFDFTGVCGRFIDSNGYSLRVGETDLSHAYRLRLQQQGSELQLLAATPSQPRELLVGRGSVPRRDKDLFVSLQLEPGWELRRRMFGERALNHVYFANPQPIDALVAASRGRGAVSEGGSGQAGLIPPPPPLAVEGRPGREVAEANEPWIPGTSLIPARGPRPSVQRQRQRQRYAPPIPASDAARTSQPPADSAGTGVVALQVIPFQETP